MQASDQDRRLYTIRLTAPDDPKTVIGYATVETIDFVPEDAGLTGARKEALAAAKQVFAGGGQRLEAVAHRPRKPGQDQMAAMVGSGKNQLT